MQLDQGVLGLGDLLRFLGPAGHPCGVFKNFLPDPNWDRKLIERLPNIWRVQNLMDVTEPSAREPLLVTRKTQARHGVVQLAEKLSNCRVDGCIMVVGEVDDRLGMR